MVQFAFRGSRLQHFLDFQFPGGTNQTVIIGNHHKPGKLLSIFCSLHQIFLELKGKGEGQEPSESTGCLYLQNETENDKKVNNLLFKTLRDFVRSERVVASASLCLECVPNSCCCWGSHFDLRFFGDKRIALLETWQNLALPIKQFKQTFRSCALRFKSVRLEDWEQSIL